MRERQQVAAVAFIPEVRFSVTWIESKLIVPFNKALEQNKELWKYLKQNGETLHIKFRQEDAYLIAGKTVEGKWLSENRLNHIAKEQDMKRPYVWFGDFAGIPVGKWEVKDFETGRPIFYEEYTRGSIRNG